jgi:hypothetical protein
VDLSRIPEPLRSKLEEQLSRLPSEVRGNLESQLSKVPMGQLDAVLRKLAPTLERLAAKQGDHASAGTPSNSRAVRAPAATVAGANAPTARQYDPHDHYNNTVQRGDRAAPPLLVIFVLVAAVVVMLRVSGIISS